MNKLKKISKEFEELRKTVEEAPDREETIDQMLIDYPPEAMNMVLKVTISTYHRRFARILKMIEDNNL